MKKQVLVCDACGKAEDIGAETSGWVSLQSMVNQEKYEALARKLAMGETTLQETLAGMDSGEFCSLPCVANWASATSNMRALDDEQLPG